MGAQIRIGGSALAVWPETQAITRLDALIYITHFADIEAYHPRLIDTILSRAARSNESKYFAPGAGGTKVHHVERWNCPAADLVHERAGMLFCRALNRAHAVADLSWANVSRRGDYCLPHSHVRAMASVVYFVDAGDDDQSDPDGGRFCFVDPRLALCCPQQDECLTRPMYPRVVPGTMLMFPGKLVHAVNPYHGSRPRITMSWNMNDSALSGAVLPSGQ